MRDAVAGAEVEVNAGVWIDGLAGDFAACAETLDGPAERGGVLGGDVPGACGGERVGDGRAMEGFRVVEDGEIAALRSNHGEEAVQRGAVGESGFGAEVAGGGRVGDAAEMEHPGGEVKREGTKVFSERGALVTEQVVGFEEFDPVAGGGAKRLAHVGEQGDGACAGGVGGGDKQSGKVFGFGGITQKSSGAGFDIENERIQSGGEFFAEDGGADERGRLDGGSAVAKGVEDAVGGDKIERLADDGGSGGAECCGKLFERERGAEAGDRFKLVERAAGVAERAAADHGHVQAAGGGDGRDEEAGLVTDAAGGVLVDGGFTQRTRIETNAGVPHGQGEGADFVEAESVETDGHQPGGKLLGGDGLGGGTGDEEMDLRFGERLAVAGLAYQIDGVHGFLRSHGLR